MSSLIGISSVLDFGGKLIDRLWPDPEKAQAAKLELFKLQQSGELQVLSAQAGLALEQIKVNTEEAKHPSLFVSGWRPAVGWVCVTACAWNWIGLSVLNAGLVMYGRELNLNPADVSEMMPVLLGLLGLGSMRTLEKINGVHRKN